MEAAFSAIKDVLELRSVSHQAEDRVRAHVLVAALALPSTGPCSASWSGRGWSC